MNPRFFDPAEVEAMTGMRLLPAPLRYNPDRNRPALPSDATTWADLCEVTHDHHGIRLNLNTGWPDQWTVTYRQGAVEQSATVRNAVASSLLTSDPIRTSTWHRNMTARAGLHHMGATGRLHWHESLLERDLLVALDFDGGITDVASQPFTLTWDEGGKPVQHTPDFLVVLDGQVWVFNVRPAERMSFALLRNAAALRAICRLRGWQEALVIGYVRPAFDVVSTLNAARKTHDVLDLSADMLDLLSERGPATFADVVGATTSPALARAVLQRLLWERDASTDLNRVLNDASLISLSAVTA